MKSVGPSRSRRLSRVRRGLRPARNGRDRARHRPGSRRHRVGARAPHRPGPRQVPQPPSDTPRPPATRRTLCREGQRGDGGRGQRPVAERPGGARAPLGPRAYRLEVHPEEAVHRELDHERDGLGRSGIVRGSPSRLSRRACACSWRPSRCSTPAQAVVSRTRSATAPPGRARCSPAARRGLGEVAGRDQRPGAGEEELDPRIGGGASGRSRSAPANQCAALAGAR